MPSASLLTRAIQTVSSIVTFLFGNASMRRRGPSPTTEPRMHIANNMLASRIASPAPRIAAPASTIASLAPRIAAPIIGSGDAIDCVDDHEFVGAQQGPPFHEVGMIDDSFAKRSYLIYWRPCWAPTTD